MDIMRSAGWALVAAALCACGEDLAAPSWEPVAGESAGEAGSGGAAGSDDSAAYSAGAGGSDVEAAAGAMAPAPTPEAGSGGAAAVEVTAGAGGAGGMAAGEPGKEEPGPRPEAGAGGAAPEEPVEPTLTMVWSQTWVRDLEDYYTQDAADGDVMSFTIEGAVGECAYGTEGVASGTPLTVPWDDCLQQSAERGFVKSAAFWINPADGKVKSITNRVMVDMYEPATKHTIVELRRSHVYNYEVLPLRDGTSTYLGTHTGTWEAWGH